MMFFLYICFAVMTVTISADLQTLENNVRELNQEMEKARQNYTEKLKAVEEAQKLRIEAITAMSDANKKGENTTVIDKLLSVVNNATTIERTLTNNAKETEKKLNQTKTALKEAQKQLEAFANPPAQWPEGSRRVILKPDIISTNAAPKSLTLSTVVLIVAVTQAIASLGLW